jgi:hypothetical protein
MTVNLSEDCWVSGLVDHLVLQKNTIFQKLDLFPSSDENLEGQLLIAWAIGTLIFLWLALSIGLNWVGFYLKREIESSLQNVFNRKNSTMENVKKQGNFINILSSQTHRSYLLIENSLSNGSTWVGASSPFCLRVKTYPVSKIVLI